MYQKNTGRARQRKICREIRLATGHTIVKSGRPCEMDYWIAPTTTTKTKTTATTTITATIKPTSDVAASQHRNVKCEEISNRKSQFAWERVDADLHWRKIVETHWKDWKHYVIYKSGGDIQNQNSMAFIVHKKISQKMILYNTISDMVIKIKLSMKSFNPC